jgi:hypothetical protein
VVANLADVAAGSVTLSLEEGPLCGIASAQVIRGPGDAAAPTITAAGGFEDYVPVTAPLGPREVSVVRLRP